ncbi:HU family DNA-binding protein [Deinococcus rubellus]|uniref:HU family DNA-binding protein n=1 Tax=Deinococcus rubellus TaxID=1889240 RepID=UPI0031ECA11D
MTKSSKKPAAPAAAKPAAGKGPAKSAASEAPTKAAVSAPALKVGKAELTDLIVTSAGLSKKDASAALSATLEVIAEALKSGQTVGLPGVGTFSVKATTARTGVRPGTSEKIQIAAGKKVSFKVATDLKKSL